MTQRLKASLIHLMGSFLLASLAMILVFWVWYPSPLADAAGVTEIFLILLGVDVVLGPAFTLLVFNPSKKTLRLDLSVIVLFQLTAFAYGLWTVAEGRPAWLVFNADRFDLVQVVDIDKRRISEAAPEFRNASWFGPKFVSASVPSDSDERKQILMEAVMAGVDIAQRPNRYGPIEAAVGAIEQKSRSLELLRGFNPVASVDSVIKKWPEADAWLPLKGKAKSVVVLVNTQTGNIVAIVDLNPWG